MSKIKTSGRLREFVTDAMVEVHSGRLDPVKASVIQKLAAQVNESLYAEAKILKMQREAGIAMPALGNLPLGESAAG